MSDIVAPEGGYPKYMIPRITPEAEEYFAGAVRGELRVQRCTTCGLHQHYPRVLCSHCGAETIEWVTAGGGGTVYSYTVIRQNSVPPFDGWLPLVVALVDLDEPGARLIADLQGIEPDAIEIGMRVQAEFRPATERVAFVDFRPVGG
jgi:uncharacterized OB-fold protein